MALVIVRHRVKDFTAWKKAFEAHAGARGSAGGQEHLEPAGRVGRAWPDVGDDGRSASVVQKERVDLSAAERIRLFPNMHDA